MVMKGNQSAERRSGDGLWPRETHEQYPATSSDPQRLPIGRGSTDMSKQNYVVSVSQGDQAPNGPPPGGGRSSREREVSQNLPIRDRSRTNGSSDGKVSGSTTRTCTKCNRPFDGKYVRALDGHFHLECFKCMVRRGETSITQHGRND